MATRRCRRPRTAGVSSPSTTRDAILIPRSATRAGRGARSEAPAEDSLSRARHRRRELRRAGFPAQVSGNAGGRPVEALVSRRRSAPGSRRWTGDESAHVDAREHLDDTIAALGRSRDPGHGQKGAADPCRRPTTAFVSSPPTRSSSSRSPALTRTGSKKGVVEAATERYAVPVTHIGCRPPATLPAVPSRHERRETPRLVGPAMCALGAACMFAAVAVDLESTAAKG